MDFFRKGSDPPPLFSEVMEPVRHISILVTKMGKNKTSQKHPKPQNPKTPWTPIYGAAETSWN